MGRFTGPPEADAWPVTLFRAMAVSYSHPYTKFSRSVITSKLVSRKDVKRLEQELRAERGEVTDRNVAERLVEEGRLNAWQVSQLFEGRTRFTLSRYQIINALGQGAEGQVFLARKLPEGTRVAIKVLPLEKATEAKIARFKREIEIQSRLSHPNLVQQLDSGHDGNVHFMVSEFIGGGDLRGLIRARGRLTLETAASIIGQVAEGLHYAHQQGVIHRDVKPANILLSEDHQAKLSDLGLIGYLGKEAKNGPEYGKIVGTADYIAPDQILSSMNPTPLWDIYSLGCTLYHAVTGTVPYPNGTTAQKLKAHLQSTPPDPREFNQYLSPEFVQCLQKMMEREPEKRFASAEQVSESLRPWTTAPAQLDFSFSRFDQDFHEDVAPGERTAPFHDFISGDQISVPNPESEQGESLWTRFFRFLSRPLQRGEMPKMEAPPAREPRRRADRDRERSSFGNHEGAKQEEQVVSPSQSEVSTISDVSGGSDVAGKKELDMDRGSEDPIPVPVQLPGNPDPVYVQPPPIVQRRPADRETASSLSMEIELSREQANPDRSFSRLRILAWLIFLLGIVPVGTVLFLLAFWRFVTEFIW